MSDIRVARDFLEEYLPEIIQNCVNLQTLKLSQNNYVDEDLNAFSSDILYEVQLNDNRAAYFYLLLEHQSSVDSLMPFRLLTYMVRIWQDHLDQMGEKTLPLIYPIIFYHGREPYYGSRSLSELIAAPPELVEEVLFKPFHLVDTHDISDLEL
jgi:predicted transposase/invertase (TIGR01784 family)